MPITKSRSLIETFPPGRFEFTPAEALGDAEFLELCRDAAPLRLERDPNGTILVMPPAGSYSSNRSLDVASQLLAWSRKNESGAAFDSSGGFRLPNGAIRAPDAAWVSSDRLAGLSEDDKEGFPPVCPDVVIEIRSKTDARSDLESKMTEYVDNGARLAWLIDPYEESVAVYRPGEPVETLDRPDTCSGDPILPGFDLDLSSVWEPGY